MDANTIPIRQGSSSDLGVALSHEDLQEFEEWGENLDGWLRNNSDLVVEIVETGMKLSSNTKQKYRLNTIERKLSLSDA